MRTCTIECLPEKSALPASEPWFKDLSVLQREHAMHRIRQATPQDEDILWHMLYEAAHMMDAGESLDDARNNPALARYVTGWGRSDDLGFIACHPDNEQAIGAAWIR
jgi:hypothetical protein